MIATQINGFVAEAAAFAVIYWENEVSVDAYIEVVGKKMIVCVGLGCIDEYYAGIIGQNTWHGLLGIAGHVGCGPLLEDIREGGLVMPGGS
eukprot:9462280-Ditylum_brightwellii.AAC.1